MRPNVSASGVTLWYEQTEPSYVAVSVYDIGGRKVREFQRTLQQAGRHRMQWDGRNEFSNFVASGVYMIRLTLTDLKGQQRQASQKIAFLR